MLWTARKGYYRTQQRVMKVAAAVLPFPEPELLEGPGSVVRLAQVVADRGHRHVLLVTDAVLMELALPQPLIGALNQAGVRVTVFSDVQPNPTIGNVEAGREAYKAAGCDGIVAFGGGSPIDAAKVIAARLGNPFLPVRWMKGLFKVVLPVPRMYCVPTTAGTGSETTIAAVISDPSTHEKFAISDLKLVPKVAVLDPELMVGLPPHITAATGMDALTHAVEAYIGRNGSRVTDGHAEETVALVFEHLEAVYRDGTDLDRRMAMAKASYHGGAAFTRAYVGYVHAIAHQLGGQYGVPHGLANAIILPHVLKAYGERAHGKLARLAVVGGLGAASEGDAALAARFIEQVEQMNERMGIPTTIAELQRADIPLIAKRALAEAHPDYPVPRIMTRAECEALVERLLP